MQRLALAAALALGLAGCMADLGGIGSEREASWATGTPVTCRVAGGGALDPEGDGADHWGGNAQPDGSGARGHVSHHTADGDHLRGTPSYLRCRMNGGGPADPPVAPANLTTWGGTGTWNGESVYWEVYAEDRGEPNTRDFYSLCVSTTAANDCDIYYTGGTLTSGNYQILPD